MAKKLISCQDRLGTDVRNSIETKDRFVRTEKAGVVGGSSLDHLQLGGALRLHLHHTAALLSERGALYAVRLSFPSSLLACANGLFQ